MDSLLIEGPFMFKSVIGKDRLGSNDRISRQSSVNKAIWDMAVELLGSKVSLSLVNLRILLDC